MYEFARHLDIHDITPTTSESEAPERQTLEVLDLPLEVAGQPVHFKLVMGDIIEAQTDTILCPLGSEFKNDLGGTLAVALEEQAGKNPFRNARRYALRHAVDLQSEGHDYRGFPFGTTRALASGDLKQRGIQHIVFANIDAPLTDPLTIEKIALIVGNALGETDRVKGKTLAVPLIGTGWLPQVNDIEAIAGTLAGIGVYQEQLQQRIFPKRTVEGLSLVAHYDISAENRELGKENVAQAIHHLQTHP